MKILVVGMGMAGLSFCYHMRDTKHVITAYEYNDAYFGNEGIIAKCAGGIGRLKFKEVKVPLPEKFIISHIDRVTFLNINRVADLRTWLGVVVDRDEWQKYLMNEVLDSDNIFVINEILDYKTLKKIYKDYDFVVGADGAMSIVRRLMNIEADDIWLTAQAEIKPNPLHNEIALCLFKEGGYVWAFDSGNIMKLGFGMPRDYLPLFNGVFQKLVEGLDVVRHYAKALTLSLPPKRLVYDKFALIGDAALLCDPLTGGGIANAIYSGYLLAEAIMRGDLNYYEKRIRKLKLENAFKYAIRTMVMKFLKTDVVEAINKMRSYLRVD